MKIRVRGSGVRWGGGGRVLEVMNHKKPTCGAWSRGERKEEVVTPWGREEGKVGGAGGGGRKRRGWVASDKQEDNDHSELRTHHNTTIQLMRKESETEGYLRTRAVPQANKEKITYVRM